MWLKKQKLSFEMQNFTYRIPKFCNSSCSVLLRIAQAQTHTSLYTQTSYFILFFYLVFKKFFDYQKFPETDFRTWLYHIFIQSTERITFFLRLFKISHRSNFCFLKKIIGNAKLCFKIMYSCILWYISW